MSVGIYDKKLNHSTIILPVASVSSNDSALDDERERLKDFHTFIKEGWDHAALSQDPFIDGLPIRAMTLHLQAIYERKIRNLIMNIPIRCAKSSTACVFFQPWVWTLNPQEQFLYTSYSADLAKRDHVYSRRLIESDWYQERWGHLVSLTSDVNTKERFENTKGGFRVSCSLSGAVLGGGAVFIFCDDANRITAVTSKAEREEAHFLISGALSTRITGPKRTCMVISQQRLHEEDVTGKTLAGEQAQDWTHLCLPMEFSPARKCKTKIGDLMWEDPRTQPDELLWPEKFDEEDVKVLKRKLGNPYYISGQLNQYPVPEAGGLFKREHFRPWREKHTPRIEFVIQSWDTALTANETSAYNAQVTVGIYKTRDGGHRGLLLSAWQGKEEFPILNKIITNFSRDYRYKPYADSDVKKDIRPADILLIEEKASGYSIIQFLRNEGIPVLGFNPNRYGDKTARAHIAAALLASGLIQVPHLPPDYKRPRDWARDFIDNVILFPNGKNSDWVDAFSQLLIYLQRAGWLINPDDPIDEIADSYLNIPHIPAVQSLQTIHR